MRHNTRQALKVRPVRAEKGSAMMNARRLLSLLSLATVAGVALSLAVVFA